MTLPVSGPISMSQVNTELGLSATTTISLNQANVRTLAGVPSGQISMSNLYGKSNVQLVFNSGANFVLNKVVNDTNPYFLWYFYSDGTIGFDAFATTASGPTAYLSPTGGTASGYQVRFLITSFGAQSSVDFIGFYVNDTYFGGSPGATSAWYNLGSQVTYRVDMTAGSSFSYINIVGQVQIQTTGGAGTITRTFTHYITGDNS